MQPRDPCGMALEDYARGVRGGVVEKRYPDGAVERLPVEAWFRAPDHYSTDACALRVSRGRVLDVGAGTGLHARHLESAGHAVTAIDVLPEAVAILRSIGLKDARAIDFLAMPAEPFDTILFLGRTIGFAGTVAGLDPVLRKCRELLAPGGQVLVTSLDVERSPLMAAQAGNRAGAGRHAGEVRFAFAYGDAVGPEIDWLYVAPDTLRERGRLCDLDLEVLCDEGDGNYLARLSRHVAPDRA